MILPVLACLMFVRVSLQIDVLSFDCATMADVCTNMCWASFCSTSPRFSENLTFDDPPANVKDRRRRAARCLPSPNRCATGKGHIAGYQCDEYPFASTAQADMGNQVTRCVPSRQNSRQGGILSNFFRGKAKGLKFKIAFQNPNAAGVFFCNPPARRDPVYCANRPVGSNNERQWQDGRIASIPESDIPRRAHKFKTSSGTNVTMLSDEPIGQRVVSFIPFDLELAGSDPDALDNWEEAETTLVERYY